jgi:hypothetical protein
MVVLVGAFIGLVSEIIPLKRDLIPHELPVSSMSHCIVDFGSYMFVLQHDILARFGVCTAVARRGMS